MFVAECPLKPDWPERLRKFLKFDFSSAEEEAFLRAAHKANRGDKIADIEAKWEIASDDCSQKPPQKGSHFYEGYPCHIHTEFEVEGRRIHIDRTWANLGGPGRLKVETHIFVDGCLAGFGGSFSSSLGVSSHIGPAVALLGDDMAIVVSKSQSRKNIDLEAVLLEPDLVALYTIVSE